MGNVQQRGKADKLTKFQREKLKYDFFTFFDLNNDGCLTYKDFLWAKDKICYMSGWKIDSPKYKITEALFAEIWDSLELIADVDKDGKITKTEWLMMWTTYKKEIMEREKEEKDFLKKYYHHSHKQHANPADLKSELEPIPKKPDSIIHRQSVDDDWPVELDSDEEPLSIIMERKKAADEKKEEQSPEAKEEEEMAREEDIAQPTILEQFAADKTNFENTKLPKWLYKYLVFRFNLLDRTGDSVIDHEEFEYVLSEFGVSEKTARQAFTIFTQNNTLELDFDYFVCLCEQYYLSDDPSDLGNFINGKLEFETSEEINSDESEHEDPGLVDHRANSSTSIHSMDDDLREPNAAELKKSKSVIRLHEHTSKSPVKRICQSTLECCCIL